MFAMTVLHPSLPLPLIDLPGDLQHDSLAMFSIILILAFVEPFFRNELDALTGLPAFLAILLPLAIIEPALIVPDNLLISLWYVENETVLEPFDNYT